MTRQGHASWEHVGLAVFAAAWLVGASAFAADRTRALQAPVPASAPALTDAMLTELLRGYVAETLKVPSASVIVRLMLPPGGLPVLSGTPVVAHSGVGKPVGRVTFTVGPVRVPAEVEAYKEVVVAARYLRRNQVLEDKDLARAPVRLAWADLRYLEDMEPALGRRVTRNVPTGLPVMEDILADPHVVRLGSRVAIQYKKGPLSILAEGIAKDDGSVGSNIRIMNVESKRELWGRVVDGDTIQVGP